MDLLGAELTPLAGGHSGETFLAQAAGERNVVRIYAGRGAGRGANAPEIDAAVLRLVRGLLPVPEVLEVRRADEAAGTPGLLVTSFLHGKRLDEVLPGSTAEAAALIGAEMGALLVRLAQMPMLRPGTFADGDLRLSPPPPEATDLREWVGAHVEGTALGEWSTKDRAALLDVVANAQQLLDDHVDRACLVHSDFNPKNLLVDPGSARVTGLLDWEFAHAGGPYTDLGNLLRFERYPAFCEAVLSVYSDGVPDVGYDLLDLARAADLFALVELAARKGANPVTEMAHDLLLAIARTGDQHATL